MPPFAKKACRLRPEKILCSDLKRCQLLAEAIAARLGLFAEPDPIWREVSFGTWENRTWSEIQAREPQVLSEWIANFDTVAPPAGESFEQLQARVLTGVEGKIVRARCDAGVTPVPQSG
ncbi:MAG TPA: histidine phosphatase family protein, partial [Chthoniobacterales bacterium]|nr:histidine phosphatase family protein [Chthoniobacterales bacterium]